MSRAPHPREMTEEEKEMVEKALVVAQGMVPYYSRALAALTPVAWDGLGTCGVDKYWRLMVDMEWFASLDPVHRAGVLAHHEVEHLIRRHHCRMPGVHPQVANLAGDLEIDDDAPPDLLPRPKLHGQFNVPEGLMAEEYLPLLPVEEHECNCAGGSGAGNPLPGELDGDSGQAPGVLDDGPLLDAIASDVSRAVQRGDHVPDSVKIWADARMEPRPIDWRVRLAASLWQSVRTGRDDWTYAKMSRRSRPDIVMPGRHGFQADVEIVVDTSGSMGPDTPSIVAGVVQKLGAAVVWVTQHDTEGRARSRAMPREWVGGGGTSLAPAISAAAKRRPSAVVVVTDGETDWPPTSVEVPVVCVCTTQAPVPDWIQTIRVA